MYRKPYLAAVQQSPTRLGYPQPQVLTAAATGAGASHSI
jgi:hypothetical protein